MATMSKISHDSASPYVLAGDIGGTNTSIALVERSQEGRFTVLERTQFSSQKLANIGSGLDQALDLFAGRRGRLELRGICLSGAGPVADNLCHTSNIPWDIDGNEIARQLGVPTRVINDFTAICYGIPLLDPNNPKQLIPLPHPDGTMPEARDFLPGTQVQAVVGAGTGLGIGFLVKEHGRYLALPSEAGHGDFGAYDERSRDLQRYLHAKIGANPGTEQFVSGQGIVNIHEYLCSREANLGSVSREILDLPREDRAPRIGSAANSDAICGRTMEFFVENYARFASAMALTFLPRGGLFLAGGIAAKNKSWFTEGNRFVNAFLRNYKESMRPALAGVPVYIVDDYGISLPGAAHGFFNQIGRAHV